MNLFSASTQWAVRPPDERFSSLQELYNVTKAYASSAAQATVPYASLRAQADGKDVVLVGKESAPARFTNYAFKQLCARVQAPAEFLSTLPPTLAAQNLNHKLATIDGESEDERMAKILFHKNGSLLVRAFTSDKYARIWNWEVAERLLRTKEYGWRVPPARPAFPDQPGTRLATAEDVLEVGNFGLSVKIGDPIAPAGIYASDHDMFVYLINEQNRVKDGSEHGLSRGVFVSNSEVGDAALHVTRFLYRFTCSNHICWDARDVTNISVRHIGHSAAYKMDKAFRAELIRYSNESASDEEAKIAKARTFTFGKTKEEVLDTLFGKRHLGITKKNLQAAYESTEQHPEDGAPNTAWGMSNGITRISQLTPYGDKRNDLDAASGRILAISF
jgi:hypothetical protein